MTTSIDSNSPVFQMFMEHLNTTCLTPFGTQSFEFEQGRRYIKVVSVTASQRMVHSFIDRTNGDVLKAASWKAPAKHARGNINAGPSGYGVSQYGANYLK